MRSIIVIRLLSGLGMLLGSDLALAEPEQAAVPAPVGGAAAATVPPVKRSIPVTPPLSFGAASATAATAPARKGSGAKGKEGAATAKRSPAKPGGK